MWYNFAINVTKMPPTPTNISPNNLLTPPEPHTKAKLTSIVIGIVVIAAAILIYLFRSAPTTTESPGLTAGPTPEQTLADLNALSNSRTTPTPTTAQQEQALKDLSKIAAKQTGTPLSEAQRLQSLNQLGKN